ncbi:MAG TPA: hypothetical protein VFR03_09715 [Thermoanaerobaculia bacterium]|nr:hypothetical protein [Thermoanaerobaculia bacterium]
MTTSSFDNAPEWRRLATAVRLLFWGNVFTLVLPLLTLRVDGRVASTDLGLSLIALILATAGTLILSTSSLVEGRAGLIAAGVAAIYCFSLLLDLASSFAPALRGLSGPGAVLLATLPAIAMCGLSIVFWHLAKTWQHTEQERLWLVCVVSTLVLFPLPFVAVMTLPWHRNPALLTVSGFLALLPSVLFLVGLHRFRNAVQSPRGKATVL